MYSVHLFIIMLGSSLVVCYCFYNRFMGNGLLTIPDYDTWKPRRQMYDPAFKKRQDLRL